MKRKFVAPRLLKPQAAQAAAAPAASAAAAAAVPCAVFDCLFSQQHKKGGSSADGTFELRGNRAQLFDLQLREKASGPLPTATATALHRVHEAAVAAVASGQPLGPLWQQEEEPDPVTLGQFEIQIEDERSAAVQQAEWQLRQRVCEEARGGKPKDAVGTEIQADNLGHKMLTAMGWQPGQGLGRQPGSTALVLPHLKWNKAGLGSNPHIKRLGAAATKFWRETTSAAASAGSVSAEP